MSKTNDGGPVYPHKEYSGKTTPGMSLRDKFALKGVDAYPLTAGRCDLSSRELAAWCYQFADAMLAARDSSKGGAA